jgi:hypothetical protein
MDYNDLVTVYTVGNPVEAEVVKNALQAEGIRCFLEGIDQAGIIGLMALEIKVQVPAGDRDRACRFIEKHQAQARKRAEKAAHH